MLSNKSTTNRKGQLRFNKDLKLWVLMVEDINLWENCDNCHKRLKSKVYFCKFSNAIMCYNCCIDFDNLHSDVIKYSQIDNINESNEHEDYKVHIALMDNEK